MRSTDSQVVVCGLNIFRWLILQLPQNSSSSFWSRSRESNEVESKFTAKIFYQWKLYKWIFMVFFQKNGVFLSASLSSKRTILQRCSINKTFSFRQTQTTLNHYRLWSFLLGTIAIFLEKSICNFSKYPLLKISTNTPLFRWPRVQFEVYCRARKRIFEKFFHFWKSEFTFYSPAIKIKSNLEILKLLPFFKSIRRKKSRSLLSEQNDRTICPPDRNV